MVLELGRFEPGRHFDIAWKRNRGVRRRFAVWAGFAVLSVSILLKGFKAIRKRGEEESVADYTLYRTYVYEYVLLGWLLPY